MTESTHGAVSVTGLRDWQKLIFDLMLPLVFDVDDPETFRASIEAQSSGGIRMFNVWADPHRVARSSELVERGTDPVYTISLQIDGSSTVEQHGNRSELRPGDLAVYDSTAPWSREFPVASRTLVVMFPQQLIALPPRALSQIAGVRIAGDSGFGRIVSAFLLGVADNLPQVTGRVGLIVAKSVVDMVSTAFVETLDTVTPMRSTSSQLELSMQIRDSIMSQLGDPELRPATIAAEHFISTRKLHAIFQSQGTTVSAWIRERRLEMSRRELADPLHEAPIREIAERWGFSDATHFSKLFRDAYGVSPRQYRATAAAPVH